MFNGARYFVSASTDLETFSAASAACQFLGGELTSILSQGEQLFLAALALRESPNNELWVGGQFSGGSASLFWLDGSAVVIGAASFESPPNGNSCVMLNARDEDGTPLGLLGELRCTRRRYGSLFLVVER